MMRGFAQGQLTLLLAVAFFVLGGPLISVGAPKLISIWFNERERKLAMGIYIIGMASGEHHCAFNHQFCDYALDGDWRKILWIYSSIVFLSGLIWFLISTHPESRKMEVNLSKLERPPQGQVFLALFNLSPLCNKLLMGICIFLYNHDLYNWMHEIL